MSAYRESEAPVIPEHIGTPKWHQLARCRVLGHVWQELFEEASEPFFAEPFPAFCWRCRRTRPEGRSREDYFYALERYVKWQKRIVTGYG